MSLPLLDFWRKSAWLEKTFSALWFCVIVLKENTYARIFKFIHCDSLLSPCSKSFWCLRCLFAGRNEGQFSEISEFQTHCSIIYRMTLILMPCLKSGPLGTRFLIGGFVPYGFGFIAYSQVSVCYFNHKTIIRRLSGTVLSLKCNGIQVMKRILISFCIFAWHAIFRDDEVHCSQGCGELMVDTLHHLIQSLCCWKINH